MSYSCTQDASHMLGVISKMYATDGNPNILTIKGKMFFFERGRENTDGSITGYLFQMLPDGMACKRGSVKIDADGQIARFPYMLKDEREAAENTFCDLRARNPQVLSAWSRGRI
jgi:hypothetical protein